MATEREFINWLARNEVKVTLQKGQRVWDRYSMEWGEVISDEPYRYDFGPEEYRTDWYEVHLDSGNTVQLDYPQRVVPEGDYRAGK